MTIPLYLVESFSRQVVFLLYVSEECSFTSSGADVVALVTWNKLFIDT
jgi:hypothetical protein